MLINNLKDDVNGLEKEFTDFKKDLLQLQAKQSDGDNAVNETLADIWQNLIAYDNQLRDKIIRLPPGKFHYYNEQSKTCNYISF